jgi:TonB family protein
MKRTTLFAMALGCFIGAVAAGTPAWAAIPPEIEGLSAPKGAPAGVELKMRILEGLRDTSTPPVGVVTSSFLRFLNYTSLPSETDAAVEKQVRQVYNLKDAKLMTEANLRWEKGKSEKAFHIFRLDGREYLILVTPSREAAPKQFHIEVFEQGEKAKASLLDMEFNVPEKNSAVFGFEDTQGKPYFIFLKVLRYGAPGGGSRIAGETVPPKLIKEVDPIYPEIARQAKVEGNVVLEATTDIYGRVQNIKVLNSIPLLDQAAIEALRQWVYEPAIIDGQPKAVTFTVNMNFRFGDKKGGVAGGVVGGVLGGVEGGVKGGAEGQAGGDFEKGAVKITGALRPPKLLKSVDPAYPEEARKAQVEGVVILEARTDEKGAVEEVKILRSIPLLNQAAIDAVKQWKYEPFISEGKPRGVLFTVTVRFDLKSGDKEKDIEEFAKGAVKVVGDLMPPKLVKEVQPVYPEDARQAKVEGVVILSVKTDAGGRVADVMILRSVPLLNQAAIDAVKQWIYKPLLINGVAKPAVFTVTVRFQLK